MRLSDRAYRLIRHQIITLELPPNTPIDEQALMEDLQLGRTPIREALQRLAAEGLVLLAPRRGMFVSEISITDLQNLFELRLVLESFCARLAAQRASGRHLAEMTALMEQLGTTPGDDAKSLMDIDEQFHNLIYQAAHNDLLAEILRRLHAQSLRIWHLLLDRLETVRPALEQHVGIAGALQARNGELAASLVQEHIAQFQEQIRASL